ncbi:MAG: hypothetical protein PHW08_14990 [Kiritimatiellae bacterium]|nr:hypothetical protein [Kiritimatiellia bacterium]
MKTFTDTAGRSWSISLSLGSAMSVKDRLDVDLLQPEVGNPPLLTRLGTDELFLGEVLCVLLEDQFEKHELSESDVKKAFDGKTLLAAQDAFYAELIVFFQNRGRTDRSTAAAKQHITIQKATLAATKKIDEIDLDKLIDKTLDDAMTPTKSGETSGALLEPSASIPEVFTK